MSSKHLKLIATSLAVLLLLWGASELFSRGSDDITGTLALPALTQGDVDTVAIVKGTDSIVLAKQSTTAWSVNGRQASLDAVNELFQALRDTAQPELVAQDSSSWSRLNVDSAAGRWLRFRAGGKPVLELVVGARGSEYSSAYVRRPGEARVHLWRGPLAQLVDRAADEWRDKRIAAVPPDSVVAVDVERGKDRYTLRRDGKAWTLNGAATDSGAVARMLEKYGSIMAAGFATPQQADSARAMRPARRLTVRGAQGVTLLSLVFDSISGGFWVRRARGAAPGGESGTVYRMNAWEVDGLTPAGQTLLPTKK
jgi:hypothetical protein